MKPQTFLNPLKLLINAAFSANKAPAPAMPAQAKPALAGQLSAVAHFAIPPVEEPPEGWVHVEDGRLKRFADLTEFEQIREELLQPLVQDWMKMWLDMADLSARFDEAFDRLDELNAPRQTQRAKAGRPGSVTRYTLDRSLCIARKRADTVRYDEDKLLAAKALIDDCVERWSEGGRDEIKQIAELSFTKNAQGEYSRSGMVRLRRISSSDPKWREAMDKIRDAELVDGVASYKLISVRDAQGHYQPLPLDIASVRPYRMESAA